MTRSALAVFSLFFTIILSGCGPNGISVSDEPLAGNSTDLMDSGSATSPDSEQPTVVPANATPPNETPALAPIQGQSPTNRIPLEPGCWVVNADLLSTDPNAPNSGVLFLASAASNTRTAVALCDISTKTVFVNLYDPLGRLLSKVGLPSVSSEPSCPSFVKMAGRYRDFLIAIPDSKTVGADVSVYQVGFGWYSLVQRVSGAVSLELVSDARGEDYVVTELESTGEELLQDCDGQSFVVPVHSLQIVPLFALDGAAVIKTEDGMHITDASIVNGKMQIMSSGSHPSCGAVTYGARIDVLDISALPSTESNKTIRLDPKENDPKGWCTRINGEALISTGETIAAFWTKDLTENCLQEGFSTREYHFSQWNSVGKEDQSGAAYPAVSHGKPALAVWNDNVAQIVTWWQDDPTQVNIIVAKPGASGGLYKLYNLEMNERARQRIHSFSGKGRHFVILEEPSKGFAGNKWARFVICR